MVAVAVGITHSIVFADNPTVTSRFHRPVTLTATASLALSTVLIALTHLQQFPGCPRATMIALYSQFDINSTTFTGDWRCFNLLVVMTRHAKQPRRGGQIKEGVTVVCPSR